jgi:site-specific DNA-methyltransferase (adenine-specific)
MASLKGGDRRLLYLKGLRRNARQRMNGIELLGRLPDGIASLVFCDPQYRTGLDYLKLGNEGARQSARHRLPQMTDDTIAFFAEESARVLKPSRYLMLWCDKFSIGTATHLKWLRRSGLQVVDLLTWNKMRIGMGKRLRAASEYLVVAQKPPTMVGGTWSDKAIPDCWSEGKDAVRHAHAKPHVLIDRLIRSCTARGDLVVDPCAGGYVVLEACRLAGREFIGCDLMGEDDAAEFASVRK